MNGSERFKNNSRQCKTDWPGELRSIARAIEHLGCRMGEDPERAILRMMQVKGVPIEDLPWVRVHIVVVTH